MTPAADTRSEHLSRLNRVLDHIHSNLDRPLTLRVLAEVSGFSPFHFHHIFKALVGETLAEYVQRARLERSANLLLSRPQETVLDAAIACGFTNAAAFSRAFRSRFGVSPRQYRTEGKEDGAGRIRNRGTESELVAGYTPRRKYDGTAPLSVTVLQLPDLHVAYIRHLQGYRSDAASRRIREGFVRVCEWAGVRQLTDSNTLVIGVPCDNPAVTPLARCRYDACITIPEGVRAAQGDIGVRDIPGGMYAACRMDFPASEAGRIGEQTDRLYGEWLPESAWQADDKPPLEIYRDTPGRPFGTWICMDYCIPIRTP